MIFLTLVHLNAKKITIIQDSFVFTPLRLPRNHCFEIRDEVFDGGFAIWVEEVKDDDDCELSGTGVTLSMNAMMERVSTKEDVPDAPFL